MARTTLDIDASVLKELKRLQKEDKRSLGTMVSELLADALARRKAETQQHPGFAWVSRAMDARIDIADKDALWMALDHDDSDEHP